MKGKIEKKSVTETKTTILAKVLRDSPLPMRGALWTPPNRPKSTQNAPKWVPEHHGRPLQSNLVAQERPRRAPRPIQIDSEPLKCLQKRFP